MGSACVGACGHTPTWGRESVGCHNVASHAPFWMWTVYVYSVCVLQHQRGPDSRVRQGALGSPLESCSQHLLLLRHTPYSLPAVIVSPVNHTHSLAAQSIQQKASRLSRVRQSPLFFLLVAGTRGAVSLLFQGKSPRQHLLWLQTHTAESLH